MKRNLIALCLLANTTAFMLASPKTSQDSLTGTWLFNLQLETGVETYGVITFHADGTAISHDTVALQQPTTKLDVGDSVSTTHGVWEKVEPGHFKVVLTNVMNSKTKKNGVLTSQPALRSKCEVDITTSGSSASGSIVQTFYPVHDIKLAQPFDGQLNVTITAERLSIK